MLDVLGRSRMYRLLLPGIRLKRWLSLGLAGMVMFSLGFALLLGIDRLWRFHQWLWRGWVQLWHEDMPAVVPTLLGTLLLVFGILLVSYSARRLIIAFTKMANPNTTVRQLVRRLLEARGGPPTVRIVGIGGGTGLSTVLRGLKEYPVELTAIVTVSDDGGSSGRLRSDFDMPPPGDLRNCLLALAETEPLMERLFLYRFPTGTGELEGHSLGNLIIAGLREMEGDFHVAIQETSRVLAVHGRVLPSANRALALRATMDDGQEVVGETAIVRYPGSVVSLAIDPPDVALLPEALVAIQEADVIIVGPGSVYSSLLPNLLIPGMAEALARSNAIKFFICNVMTQPGESDHFSAARHLEVILEHLPCPNPFHYAVVNTTPPTDEVMAVYAKHGQEYVQPDLQQLRALGVTPVTGDLLAATTQARHEPARLARCILETVATDIKWPNVLRRRDTPVERNTPSR
jgi:uncharacterized cofD-like protein